MHWADERPAWLWSADGSTLIWRNNAARLFNARLKKDRLKLSPEAVPIKGQVARLMRLGSLGRSSLSRLQFLAGEKPLATTCSCTPLAMPTGETALLLVGVDPIPAEIRAKVGEMQADLISEALFPPGASYRLVEGGTALPEDAIAVKASPGEDMLVFTLAADTPQTIEDARDEEGVSVDDREEYRELADMPEPVVTQAEEPETATAAGALSSLFDRLAGHADLYSPLSDADEATEGTPAEPSEVPAVPSEDSEGPASEPDMIAAVIEYSDDPEEEDAAPVSVAPNHWLITGRGFRALAPKPPEDEATEGTPEPEAGEPVSPPDANAEPPDTEPEASDLESEPPDAEATPAAVASPPREPDPPLADAVVDQSDDVDDSDRVTRYNFEELGRILSDRVASEAKSERPVFTPTPTAPAAGIINLNAETLVLNRLPLAILVFRDQQVLFANRALTDLLGHESVESLREAGIGSIFPAEDAASAGPVNRLIRRDGTPLSVTARLQSVSWQGRAALMLSASVAEAVRGHEGAVRAFAQIAAEARGEGYISADRSGTVTFVSAPGRALLGLTEAELVGKPLAMLIGSSDMEPLRAFLEKPARFAETTRPHLTAVSENGEADIALFAEGQAGVVTGYFGFIKPRRAPVAPVLAGDDELEPGMLARLSRGIRRPLNTIIGFADLLRSSAVEGVISNERTAEYARDIRTAGLEIAVLTDELDDFTRLRDGRYAPRPSDVDLGALLDSCMTRVRAQAAAARVLVRSAISEQLPRIRADRSSLGQALLNLLASAIDQTPLGGSVILSAQPEEDGGITIHVRDGAQSGTDMGERFVVFRDGVDKDGGQLGPVRSSVGLALTRSLLAVNACSLSVDPTATTGTLFSLTIPPDAIVRD
jgi:PAS domain-containing protein